MLRLEIADDRVDVAEQLVDEGHHLPHLDLDELPPALLCNLDERIASHVLDTLVSLVHEFEQLVHDCLQEPPMGAEETRILSNDVHDVRGDDGLVVFALLLLAQTEQVLDDGDQEPLLVLFVHGTRDGADCPAEGVQVLPAPFVAVHLVLQPLRHDALRVDVVQMGEVDEGLSHVFVHVDRVRVFHELPHDFALVILHHQHFLWFRHSRNHCVAHLCQNGLVKLCGRVTY